VLGASGGRKGKSGEESRGEREGELSKAHCGFPCVKWLRGHDIASAVGILSS
jgi:hypothetical protein